MDNMKKTAGLLQAQGRHGDTILAHINPQEAKMLKAAGGSGTINPETGLPEFSFWTSIRNAFQTVAVVAGNYFLPGSSLVTSKLVSKGSQEQLSSTLGQVATMASSIYGGSVGNLSNYGNLLAGRGLTGMSQLQNGATSATDWLSNFGSPGEAATKVVTPASSMAGGAGISTNPAEFMNAGGSPTNIPGTGFPGSMSGAATGATSSVIPPAQQGLLSKIGTWAGNNPVPALMAGQTVMAGIGGMATAESQAEQAQLNRDAQLQRDTVQGGFANPRAVTVNDPNLVTDVAGRYIRGPRAGQYAPGRAPGLLSTARA